MEKHPILEGESLLEEKINLLKKKYLLLPSPEARYTDLIEMGRNLPPLLPEQKTEETLVRGCQSRLYLFSEQIDGKIFFKAEADALISAGLAALLLSIYSGHSPEEILKTPGHFLSELGIYASLSPNRSNGLSQILARIKKDALKFLMQK